MSPARTYNIALFPGDGIGIEVVEQAVRVLEAVQARAGTFALSMTRFPWGADYWAETGLAQGALTADLGGTLTTVQMADAVIGSITTKSTKDTKVEE